MSDKKYYCDKKLASLKVENERLLELYTKSKVESEVAESLLRRLLSLSCKEAVESISKGCPTCNGCKTVKEERTNIDGFGFYILIPCPDCTIYDQLLTRIQEPEKPDKYKHKPGCNPKPWENSCDCGVLSQSENPVKDLIIDHTCPKPTIEEELIRYTKAVERRERGR